MAYEKLGEQYEFTQPVALYYARGLFVPSAMPGVVNAEEKYNCWFLMDQSHSDFNPLWALLKKVALFKLAPVQPMFAKMPVTAAEKSNMQLRYSQNPGYSHPFLSGDRYLANLQAANKSIETLEHLRGKVILTTRSGKDYPPRLGGVVNNVARDFDGPMREAQRSQFYNGVLVYPKVYLRVFEAFGGGVSARVSSVFSTNEGERLAGGEGAGTAIPTGFTPHSGGVSTADPFADDFVGTTGVSQSPTVLDDNTSF